MVAENTGHTGHTGHTSGKSSSAQLVLLQQALKSREDAVSGARWCLGCGKRFMDVFKLAQHIKDRHDGFNGPDGEARGEQRAGAGEEGAGVGPGSFGRSGRAVRMGDYLGFSDGGVSRGGVSRGPARDAQKTAGGGKRGEEQGRRGLDGKHPHGGERKKTLSSLKKKYVREKRKELRETWDGVRASIEENIRLVEGFVEGCVSEKDGVDWWGLEGQVRWYRGYVAGRFLNELREMRGLCMGKLKTLEGRVGRGGRRKGAGRVRGEDPEVGVVGVMLEKRGARDAQAQEQIQPSQEGMARERDERVVVEHAVEDGGSVHEEVGEVWEGNEDGVYDSLDDSDSSASDDSFDLQWGDTLQTWAHSLGHASLKSLSRAEEETLVHQQAAPLLLDVELPDLKGRGRKHDSAGSGAGAKGAEGAEGACKDADGSNKSGVRVVINATGAGRGAEAEAEAAPVDGRASICMPSEDLVVPWFEEFRAFNTATAPIYCAVCHNRRVFAWDEHLASKEHGRRLETLAKHDDGDLPVSMKSTPLTKNHHLSVEPKRYVGEAADVEPYVTHVITEDLNAKVVALLSKLISWQMRTKEMDPMNAKRKKRLLSGMREVGKAVRLGKVCGLIVAPNVQRLHCDSRTEWGENGHQGANEGDEPGVGVNETSEAAGSGYPIEGILEAARAHGVPVVFALTRRKMGKLLGQKKTVSVFALLNVQGAEQEFDEVFKSCMT